VHGLPSLRHVREVGALGTIAIFCQSFALVLSCLGWPAFSVGFLWAVLSAFMADTPVGPAPAGSLALGTIVIVLGVATVLRGLVRGAARRGVPLRPSDVLLLPLYFLLVNWAAWRAVWELVNAPYHWSKTEHGVSRGRKARPPHDGPREDA
jgi:hypothetical protein